MDKLRPEISDTYGTLDPRLLKEVGDLVAEQQRGRIFWQQKPDLK